MTINYKLIIAGLFLLSFNWASAYSAEVYIDTKDYSVNAVEGSVVLPVKDTKIQTGRSVVTIWIELPKSQEGDAQISFSGISPGGFSGLQPLFTIVGEGEIDLSQFRTTSIKALKSDGTAIAVPVRLGIRNIELEEDTLAPESFDLAISRDVNLYENSRFLTFSAQDKGSGLEHYEFATSWVLSPSEDSFTVVSSPLKIGRIDNFKKLFIKAVDNKGNERVESIAGPYYYLSWVFGLIIILCILYAFRRSF